MKPLKIGYYKINGTDKVLYWQGFEWFKPEKNGYVSRIIRQPKVKSFIETEL